MEPIAYLNGKYQPLDETRVSPMDRGFLFGDGVYEVIPVFNSRTFRLNEHIARLQTGLKLIDLDSGMSADGWKILFNELIKRNGGGDLKLYLQVTRGAPTTRDHVYGGDITPTIFAVCHPLTPAPESLYQSGIKAVVLEDRRWLNCQIKTVSLLGNVMAKQEAHTRGAQEAVLIRDGVITEGSTSNVFLVLNGVITTPLKDHRILPGITRDLIIELAAEHDMQLKERDVAESELPQASEIWFASSTRDVIPVTEINGKPVGSGAPGPVAIKMRQLFQSYKEKACPA